MEPINTDIVRALVAAGANLEAVVPGSEVTPLMSFAAMGGNVDAVTILLEAGANRDAVEPSARMTALMGAAGMGKSLPVVRKLVVFIPPAERKKIRENVLGSSLECAQEDSYPTQEASRHSKVNWCTCI